VTAFQLALPTAVCLSLFVADWHVTRPRADRSEAA
jgi:hypothetical protein